MHDSSIFVSYGEQVVSILTCPKLAKLYQIELLKVSKNDQFENLYISSHGKARNIKFGQQVNIIKRVTLGTLPQEVVMSLAHNHVANLVISSGRGATVIRFVS